MLDHQFVFLREGKKSVVCSFVCLLVLWLVCLSACLFASCG